MTFVCFVVLQQRLATIENFRLLLANHIVGIDFPALPTATSFAYHSNTVLVLALWFGILVLWQLRRMLGKTCACFWQYVQSWWCFFHHFPMPRVEITTRFPQSTRKWCKLFVLQTFPVFFQGVLYNFKRKPWSKCAVLGKTHFQQCNGTLVRKRGNVPLFSTQAVQIAQKKRVPKRNSQFCLVLN